MPKNSQNKNKNDLSSVAIAKPWYLKLWRPKSLVVTYTETMRRTTNTNIKTGITKHKYSSPQSCRSSLQRQEVQEGESQAGTCGDQLSKVAILVVMMDHHWWCHGGLWKERDDNDNDDGGKGHLEKECDSCSNMERVPSKESRAM